MNRLYYMDALRSVLMMLGIVLHTSQIYNPAQVWRVPSNETTMLAGGLVHFIAQFRMPAFFLVSGFFCAMTLQKYGSSLFVKIRMKRILIPLLVTGLLLNSIQSAILHLSGSVSFNPTSYFLEGGWISHLWFLVTLLAYFATAAILYLVAKKQVKWLVQTSAATLMRIPMVLTLTLLPLLSVAIFALSPLGFPLYSKLFFEIFSVYRYVASLPFFIFGAVIFFNQGLLKEFSSVSMALLIPLTVIAFILLFWIPWPSAVPDIIVTAVSVYAASLASWVMSAGLFQLFQLFFNKKSALWTFLSEASYTIYLFHHVIVITLGLIAVKLGLPPLLGLVTIIGLSLALTVGIHKYLIRNSKLLQFAFNGR